MKTKNCFKRLKGKLAVGFVSVSLMLSMGSQLVFADPIQPNCAFGVSALAGPDGNPNHAVVFMEGELLVKNNKINLSTNWLYVYNGHYAWSPTITSSTYRGALDDPNATIQMIAKGEFDTYNSQMNWIGYTTGIGQVIVSAGLDAKGHKIYHINSIDVKNDKGQELYSLGQEQFDANAPNQSVPIEFEILK